MCEVAIILSDLYPAANGRGAHDRAPGLPQGALPALARIARFAGVSALPGDWRAWLAGWLGRADLGSTCNATPAAVAAGALPADGKLPGGTGSVWLATPLNLVAGLTSVHLDHRGLLKLDAATSATLCQDFAAAFAERGFALRQLTAGGLIACGPRFAELPLTCDPARLLGGGIAGSTVHGPGAAPLLSLGAELEMWLHAHPLNAARVRRGAAPLTTLWLWGGGEPLAPPPAATPLPTGHPGAALMSVFGTDPVAAGLCVFSGARLCPPARSAQDILASGAVRTAAVIELFHMGQSQVMGQPRAATLPELLQQLDETILAPLVTALRQGALRQLILIANDRCSVLSARAGLRFWRRSRAPLAVLQ